MKSEDIIECLNKYTKNKIKGFFVLHKTINNHPTFKALKVYKYRVVYVLNKDNKEIFTIQITDRVIDGHDDIIVKKMNEELMIKLFEFIDNKGYETIEI